MIFTELFLIICINKWLTVYETGINKGLHFSIVVLNFRNHRIGLVENKQFNKYLWYAVNITMVDVYDKFSRKNQISFQDLMSHKGGSYSLTYCPNMNFSPLSV